MRAIYLVLLCSLLISSAVCARLVKPSDGGQKQGCHNTADNNDEIDRHPHVFRDHSAEGKSSKDDFAADPEETKTEFWRKSAEAVLTEKEKFKLQFGTARNIIFFLGDGMSIPTLLAARVEKGRRNKVPGPEKEHLSFETFPIVGLSKTYCVNSQVADSACTATAYLTGVKTNIHTIGINANVVLGKCSTQNNVSNHVDSIVDWAQRSKRSTGVVTTTRVTHASPAGCYAHIADREWEWDARITDNSEPCDDIAKQLVRSTPGKDINVVLGGGYGGFLPSKRTKWGGLTGNRNDQADLLDEWVRHKTDQKKVASVVFNRTALRDVDTNKTDYLMGLFNKSHMKYTLDKGADDPEPSLAEMTEAAIKILQKNPDGFFLFVEGGEIDFGHHDTLAHQAIEETLEFSKAIERAVELTSIEDTLIVVTADHAHTMSVSGYPERGNDIFKLADRSDVDKLPIATLSYANGPGYKKDRIDLSKEDLDNPHYEYPALAPMKSETHAGDDVGIFARGPWSYLFTGVIEQNVIPMAMARAGQFGQFEDSRPVPGKSASFAASPILSFVFVVVLLWRRNA